MLGGKAMPFTLRLPPGKLVPTLLQTASPDETYEIITLGVVAWEAVQTQRSDESAKLEIAALRKQYEDELAALRTESETREREVIHRITKQNDADKAALRAENERSEAAGRERLLEIQKTRNALEFELTRIRAEGEHNEERVIRELTTAKEKEIAALNAKAAKELAASEAALEDTRTRKQRLEQEFDVNSKKAVEQERVASERILAAKEAELRRILDEKEKERVHYQELYAKISQTVESALPKKPTSIAEKGTAFENEMIDNARKYWGSCDGFSIHDQSAHGHKGDIWMGIGLGERCNTILIECKDYSDIVPTKEVTKFLADMKQNNILKIGIMISKKTDITGRNTQNKIDFTVIEGKLHIFVNQFDSFDESTIMNILMGFIRYWQEIQKPASDVEDKAEVIKIIQKLFEKAQKYKTELKSHLDHLKELSEFVKKESDETYVALHEALRTLRHGVSETVLENSIIYEDATGNPHKQKRIRAIQDVAEEDADSVILLNDLAKRIAERTKQAEKTVKEHIESVLQSDYVEKKAGFPTKVKGLRLKEPKPEP